jgi:hypothetical protein
MTIILTPIRASINPTKPVKMKNLKEILSERELKRP